MINFIDMVYSQLYLNILQNFLQIQDNKKTLNLFLDLHRKAEAEVGKAAKAKKVYP